MPLELIDTGGVKPVFVCDYCDNEITDAFDGNFQWNYPPQDVKRITDIKFLHKKCTKLYSEKFGIIDCSLGMENLMVYLLNNLGLTTERLEKAYESALITSQL
jgi:hypothetical protein